MRVLFEGRRVDCELVVSDCRIARVAGCRVDVDGLLRPKDILNIVVSG